MLPVCQLEYSVHLDADVQFKTKIYGLSKVSVINIISKRCRVEKKSNMIINLVC